MLVMLQPERVLNASRGTQWLRKMLADWRLLASSCVFSNSILVLEQTLNLLNAGDDGRHQVPQSQGDKVFVKLNSTDARNNAQITQRDINCLHARAQMSSHHSSSIVGLGQELLLNAKLFHHF
jgi:hypothetical protein